MNLDQMPQVIKHFIMSSNKPDPTGFVNCFAEDAVVMDEGKARRGKDAIKNWSDNYHFSAHVTLAPMEVMDDEHQVIVTCKLDGEYDKTGLPDPLVLDYHFEIKDNKITYLSIE
jgi:ketosteroid isomerase-like protein